MGHVSQSSGELVLASGRVETHDTLPAPLRIAQTAVADVELDAPHRTSDEHVVPADVHNPYSDVYLAGKPDFHGRIWGRYVAPTNGSDFLGDTAITRKVTQDHAAALVR